MIGKLKGIIEEIAEDHTLIDVNGVCYVVFLSTKSLASLPAEGEAASLFIETHVREDHIHLYGFASAEEREWYRLVTTVQGVGSKMGLAILGAFSPAELSHAIQAKDTKLLTRANGVGPKLAERIVTELKSKVLKMPVTTGEMTGTVAQLDQRISTSKTAANSSVSYAAPVEEEAVSALVNLGYGRAEAYQAVASAKAKCDDDTKVEAIIRYGLQELAS